MVEPNLEQETRDRLQVAAALNDYWHALGRLDIPAAMAMFTPDALFGSHRGHPEIRARLEHSQGRLSSLVVLPGAQTIKVKGDEANAETQAVAFGVVPGDAGDRLLVQGIRYGSKLTRTPQGWRIAERCGVNDASVINDVDFQFELMVGPAK